MTVVRIGRGLSHIGYDRHGAIKKRKLSRQILFAVTSSSALGLSRPTGFINHRSSLSRAAGHSESPSAFFTTLLVTIRNNESFRDRLSRFVKAVTYL